MTQGVVASATDVTSHAGKGGTAQNAAALCQFISFGIGDDQHGVDIMAVREIKEWSNVTNLPKQPEFVRGLLNLRGVMVPIVDLRCRFGEGLTQTMPTHIIFVVRIDERSGRPARRPRARHRLIRDKQDLIGAAHGARRLIQLPLRLSHTREHHDRAHRLVAAAGRRRERHCSVQGHGDLGKVTSTVRNGAKCFRGEEYDQQEITRV